VAPGPWLFDLRRKGGQGRTVGGKKNEEKGGKDKPKLGKKGRAEA